MTKPVDTDQEIVRIATYWDPNVFVRPSARVPHAFKDIAFLLAEIKRLREALIAEEETVLELRGELADPWRDHR